MRLVISCKNCNVHFEGHESRKFCSSKCYQQSKIGNKQSPGCTAKRSATMTGRKYSEERRKNIGAARLIHLSADTLAELNRLLEIGMPDGYIRNVLKVSRKVYQRHKATIYPNGIPWQLKWLENNIEPLAIEKIVEQTKKWH